MPPTIASLRSAVPWWVRIPGKLLLTAVPISTRHLKRMALFHYGEMESPEYANRVFNIHYAAFERFRQPDTQAAFTCLELGPGDSLFSAILARARGAFKTWLVDVADLALRDVRLYRAMAWHLGRPDLAEEHRRTAGEILAGCSAVYLTEGLRSLQVIPSASVDFAWSHAVLHSVRRDEFAATLKELRRIMKPGGVCSHEVDLRDMFGGSLNHLRFSSRWWESGWVGRAGIYSNRIGFNEMMQAFSDTGFATLSLEKKCWQALPVPRAKLARRFRNCTDEELLVQGFQVALRAV